MSREIKLFYILYREDGLFGWEPIARYSTKESAIGHIQTDKSLIEIFGSENKPKFKIEEIYEIV